jgi:hypothetical protein
VTLFGVLLNVTKHDAMEALALELVRFRELSRFLPFVS